VPKPLDGVVVVDLTIALAGPYATQLLGALGATVIKVEAPGRGDPARDNAPYLGKDGVRLAREDEDDQSVSMLERGRNKLSVTLDLKHREGLRVFDDLVRTADVVVENFSAGVADRLGVGYRHVSEINDRIVYLSVSGFGAGEPGKGFDAIFQALSGLTMTPGSEGDPPVRNAVPLGDLIGPLFGVIGTLAALVMREKTGRGQQVDVGLLGALTSLVATEPWDALERSGIGVRPGNLAPRLAPFGIFPTKDGHVAICAHTDGFARDLLAVVELDDPRFATRGERVANATELHALIAEWTAGLASRDVVAGLEARGVPVAIVRDHAAAVRDPHALRRGETVELADDLYGSGFPVRFSGAEPGYDLPAPRLGEHTDFVLGGLLGYSPERVEELRAAGAV
jgi:crotonobetainyl-CoA:carnitine CoA-transferase CaiB-like acyl-CoA transferase